MTHIQRRCKIFFWEGGREAIGERLWDLLIAREEMYFVTLSFHFGTYCSLLVQTSVGGPEWPH